jgi:DNA-binding response OmpR family regulator
MACGGSGERQKGLRGLLGPLHKNDVLHGILTPARRPFSRSRSHRAGLVTVAHTILVIDDQVSLARAFALALESVGYAVNIAHTAEDGLRLAQCEHPAAIILDIRMPFISGTGFLYRLRALPQHHDTPVMVVTGASVNEELQAELADLRAVVRFKPLGLTDLIKEVHALLSRQPGSSSGSVHRLVI